MRVHERLHGEAADQEAGPQPKKRSALATERDEFLRAAWRVMVSGELCSRRLVFVDEMGANTSLHELYAYSPRGERTYCSVARNRGKNTTLLASMSLSGMGASMVVEGAGAEILYLPPYSPDFNPIEEAFSKIKNLLRKAGARVREVLIEAIGEAISEVTEEDARAFFEHCGYCEMVQLL